MGSENIVKVWWVESSPQRQICCVCVQNDVGISAPFFLLYWSDSTPLHVVSHFLHTVIRTNNYEVAKAHDLFGENLYTSQLYVTYLSLDPPLNQLQHIHCHVSNAINLEITAEHRFRRFKLNLWGPENPMNPSNFEKKKSQLESVWNI